MTQRIATGRDAGRPARIPARLCRRLKHLRNIRAIELSRGTTNLPRPATSSCRGSAILKCYRAVVLLGLSALAPWVRADGVLLSSVLRSVTDIGSTPLLGGDVMSDRVPTAARVLGAGDVNRTGIQSLGYGTNSKLHLQFNSRLWNKQGPRGVSTGTTYADTGCQNTWDVSRAQSGSSGILVDYTGGNIGATFSGDPTDPAVVDAYAKKFLGQIEPVFSGITRQWNGRATLDYPAGNPYLLGSYSDWKTGQYTLFSESERERSRKCQFAGEHCSINFQGFMAGGAQEGARAANEILSDHKAAVFP